MSNKLGSLNIIRQTNDVHTATVIFFHGSGDTGSGCLEWVKSLIGDMVYPHLKLIFPTAPLRHYTPLGGELSNVWFDRYAITPNVPEHRDTLAKIETEINQLIDKEVKSGIPLNRIIVGGFSMGGTLALHTAYRFRPGMAGAFTLSSFLNNESAVYEALKDKTQSVDTLLNMYHGNLDELVPYSWGKDTYEKLRNLNVKGDFQLVENIYHEMNKKELKSLFKWIEELLPNTK